METLYIMEHYSSQALDKYFVHLTKKFKQNSFFQIHATDLVFFETRSFTLVKNRWQSLRGKNPHLAACSVPSFGK